MALVFNLGYTLQSSGIFLKMSMPTLRDLVLISLWNDQGIVIILGCSWDSNVQPGWEKLLSITVWMATFDLNSIFHYLCFLVFQLLVVSNKSQWKDRKKGGISYLLIKSPLNSLLCASVTPPLQYLSEHASHVSIITRIWVQYFSSQDQEIWLSCPLSLVLCQQEFHIVSTFRVSPLNHSHSH